MLILHYLGLDHIGHLSGPNSPLIGPKLSEMDNIISKIHKSLLSEVRCLSFEDAFDQENRKKIWSIRLQSTDTFYLTDWPSKWSIETKSHCVHWGTFPIFSPRHLELLTKWNALILGFLIPLAIRCAGDGNKFYFNLRNVLLDHCALALFQHRTKLVTTWMFHF